jgi:hypothetical protein
VSKFYKERKKKKKMLFFLFLAVASASITELYDAAYYEFNVPSSNIPTTAWDYVYKFDAPDYLLTATNPIIEITAEFSLIHMTDSTAELYMKDTAVFTTADPGTLVVSVDQWGDAVALPYSNSSASTIYFAVNVLTCTTCITSLNSVTVYLSIRLMDGTVYIRDISGTTPDTAILLHTNYESLQFEIAQAQYAYFSYPVNANGTLYFNLEITNPANEMLLYGRKGAAPTAATHDWHSPDAAGSAIWDAGDWMFGVYGQSGLAGDINFQFTICDDVTKCGVSALLPAFFLLALLMLL